MSRLNYTTIKVPSSVCNGWLKYFCEMTKLLLKQNLLCFKSQQKYQSTYVIQQTNWGLDKWGLVQRKLSIYVIKSAEKDVGVVWCGASCLKITGRTVNDRVAVATADWRPPFGDFPGSTLWTNHRCSDLVVSFTIDDKQLLICVGFWTAVASTTISGWFFVFVVDGSKL